MSMIMLPLPVIVILPVHRLRFSIEAERFTDEIVPVPVKQNRDTREVVRDEHPRPDTTLESLARNRPAFEKDGTVTAGNASGLNDGASAVVLASKEAVAEFGLTP